MPLHPSAVRFAAGLALILAPAARAEVFPALNHSAYNVIPFGTAATHHQVFAASLFSNATNGRPAHITAIALAPGVATAYTASITVRLGYTDAVPGATAVAGGLQAPAAGGGGAPNADGPMTDFFVDETYAATFTAASPSNFQMSFVGTAFDYDPALGNLLVEFVVTTPSPTTLNVSRAVGGVQSSRAYRTGSAVADPASALRMLFTFTAVPLPPCYPNCDNSTVAPILNVLDFNCFLNRFTSGDTAANCDGSTEIPELNVLDFNCFLNAFTTGCP
jgi:hypothetical protein